MKKTTFAIAWLLGCTLGLSAQEAETPKPHETKVKLSNTADGFANYYSGMWMRTFQRIQQPTTRPLPWLSPTRTTPT